ncbi:hypothetical protein [Rhizobium yanglingense]
MKQFSEMPLVIEILRLTGEDCFDLSPLELETIVDTIARHGAVTTSLVLRGEPPKPLVATCCDRIRQSATCLTKAMFWIFAQT